MPKLNKMRLLLFATLFPLLISCTPTPPDVPVFEYLPQYMAMDPNTGHMVLKPSPACMTQIQEVECGHGVYIVSGKEIYIGNNPGHLYNGKSWSILKQQSVYMPAAESYAPIATYMINSCKKNNCSAQVDKYKIHFDSLTSLQSLMTTPK